MDKRESLYEMNPNIQQSSGSDPPQQPLGSTNNQPLPQRYQQSPQDSQSPEGQLSQSKAEQNTSFTQEEEQMLRRIIDKRILHILELYIRIPDIIKQTQDLQNPTSQNLHAVNPVPTPQNSVQPIQQNRENYHMDSRNWRGLAHKLENSCKIANSDDEEKSPTSTPGLNRYDQPQLRFNRFKRSLRNKRRTKNRFRGYDKLNNIIKLK